jgi:hypothetical protein
MRYIYQIKLMELYFAQHLLEAFTPLFDKLLGQTEILAMECACCDNAEEVERYWNAVSNGEAIHRSSALSPMEEFTDELLDRLMLQNKVIIFERSPFKKSDQDRADDLYEESRTFWECGEIEKAVRRLGEYDRELASQSVQRDIEYSKQLKSLTNKYPGKTILCSRGIVHFETLPILLSQQGVSFSSYLFTEPYVHPFAEEVVVRLIKGQEVSDKALMLRHIEQDLIFEAKSYDYETKIKIREKVLSMSEDGLKSYVAKIARK